MAGVPWDHPDADPMGDMREFAVAAKRRYVEGLADAHVSDAERFERFLAERYPGLYAWVYGEAELS